MITIPDYIKRYKPSLHIHTMHIPHTTYSKLKQIIYIKIKLITKNSYVKQ